MAWQENRARLLRIRIEVTDRGATFHRRTATNEANGERLREKGS